MSAVRHRNFRIHRAFKPAPQSFCAPRERAMRERAMSGSVVWLYLLIGQAVALIALFDDEAMATLRKVARQVRWWVPYAGAALFIIMWPPATLFLLLLPGED